MMLTLANLQPLAGQFKGEGLLVSCYADLSRPENAVRWKVPFKVKATAIMEMLADNPQAQRQFEDNFEALDRALETPELRHSRGLAVFSARQRGFFQAFALEVPVENELVVDQSPYLVPLLQVISRQREYLVVLTDTHRGRLFAASPGRVRLLQEIEEAVPSRQHSAGERWGKQQATIARHREDRILHYQKDLLERIEKAWAEIPFQGIVFLGEHEVLEHLRKQLPPRLAAQVVSERPQAWTEKPLAVSEGVCAALADLDQANERRLLEGLEERLSQDHDVIARGPREVVEALQKGRIGPRGHGFVVLGPDPRETVARCSACRSLFVDMPTTCPRCQAPCVDASLWEEIMMQALRHDIAVQCVKAEGVLARHGGVAALATLIGAE